MNDEAGTYRDALQTVLDNIIFSMLLSLRLLLLPGLPQWWARVGEAAAAFKKHMLRMLLEETKLLKEGLRGSGSLITSFVRAL